MSTMNRLCCGAGLEVSSHVTGRHMAYYRSYYHRPCDTPQHVGRLRTAKFINLSQGLWFLTDAVTATLRKAVLRSLPVPHDGWVCSATTSWAALYKSADLPCAACTQVYALELRTCAFWLAMQAFTHALQVQASCLAGCENARARAGQGMCKAEQPLSHTRLMFCFVAGPLQLRVF